MEPSVMQFLIQALRQRSLNPNPPGFDELTLQNAQQQSEEPPPSVLGTGLMGQGMGKLRERQRMLDGI